MKESEAIAVYEAPRRIAQSGGAGRTHAARFFWLLSALLSPANYPIQALAHEESIPITTAAKVKESQETSSWEEPSLFPQELPDLTTPLPPNRKQRSTDDMNERLSRTPVEMEEAIEGQSAATFQTVGDRPFPDAPIVGLESTRERDSILAKLQDEGVTQPYNIKIGRLPLMVRGGFGAEFSDNFERTNRSKDAELILIPRLDISGSVKLGSKTSLSIGLGIGYIKYLARSENDRLLLTASLTPDSGISLNIKVGKFLISVYDKPSLPQFQADAATQRQQIPYNQFTNTAGLRIFWDVNSRVNVSFGYGHSDSLSFSSDKSTTDGSTDSFMAALSYKLSESLGIGIDAGAQTMKYKSDLLNDGTTYNIGPFVTIGLSRFLRLQASVGYQGGSYENTGSVEDDSSLGTYFANVRISNDLNTRISHSLTFGRQSQQGSVSNFSVSSYVRYQIAWDLVRGVNIGGTASFEDIEESGGLFAAHFQTYSLGVYFGMQVTKKLSLNLLYAFTTRYVLDDASSQESSLDFNENRISLNIGYSF